MCEGRMKDRLLYLSFCRFCQRNWPKKVKMNLPRNSGERVFLKSHSFTQFQILSSWFVFQKFWLHPCHTNKLMLWCLLSIQYNKQVQFLYYLFFCPLDVLFCERLFLINTLVEGTMSGNSRKSLLTHMKRSSSFPDTHFYLFTCFSDLDPH